MKGLDNDNDDGNASSRSGISRKSYAMPALLAALALSASTLWLSNLPSSNKHSRPTCPAQVSPIVPAIEFGRLEDSVYADEAAHRLARAVSFATVSYDDGGPVETDVNSFYPVEMQTIKHF